MSPQEIAMALGLFIVVDVAKDAASYLIQKGLGKNGNRKSGEPVCQYHYEVVGDIAEVKTDVKWIRSSLEHNRVGSIDPRD